MNELYVNGIKYLYQIKSNNEMNILNTTTKEKTKITGDTKKLKYHDDIRNLIIEIEEAMK